MKFQILEYVTPEFDARNVVEETQSVYCRTDGIGLIFERQGSKL